MVLITKVTLLAAAARATNGIFSVAKRHVQPGLNRSKGQ